MPSDAVPQPVTLPEDLVEFIESGVSVQVGTRDAALRPEAARGVGCVVHHDRRTLSLLLNEATATRTVANIAAGSWVSLTFSRPVDHRTVQIKGPATVRAGTEVDRAVAERYLAAYTEALYVVGVSRAVVRRLRVAPCAVAEVEVAELYTQTPGPEAGQRLVRP